MADMRTPIVAFLCVLLLESTMATSVQITKEWKPNFGWEVTCHWTLDMDDSLQSVALSRNKQQFFLFRPETLNGELRKAKTFNLAESVLGVECMETVERGIKGRCTFSIKPLTAPKHDFTFGCAVSGERPYFKFAEDEDTVEALVPPSETIMVVTKPESGAATINCSSSGIPAPRIIWTVHNQTVPHNFHKSAWNATSKLWDVWSTFTPQTDAAGTVQCTPEILKGNQLIKGHPVQYNVAYRIVLDAAILTFAVLSSLLLR